MVVSFCFYFIFYFDKLFAASCWLRGLNWYISDFWFLLMVEVQCIKLNRCSLLFPCVKCTFMCYTVNTFILLWSSGASTIHDGCNLAHPQCVWKVFRPPFGILLCCNFMAKSGKHLFHLMYSTTKWKQVWRCDDRELQELKRSVEIPPLSLDRLLRCFLSSSGSTRVKPIWLDVMWKETHHFQVSEQKPWGGERCCCCRAEKETGVCQSSDLRKDRKKSAAMKMKKRKFRATRQELDNWLNCAVHEGKSTVGSTWLSAPLLELQRERNVLEDLSWSTWHDEQTERKVKTGQIF